MNSPYVSLRATMSLEVINDDDDPKVIGILDTTYVVVDENCSDLELIECYNKAADIIRG